MKDILYLAPLQGFTDVVFRNAYSQIFNGFDTSIAPFISALPEGRFKKKEIKDILPENNTRLPVIPQIMSNNADDFAGVAEMLVTLGYETVNWNLGCPYKMVAKKKRGSGLLCHPDLIDSFLERIFNLISCRLSVKIRIGRNDEREVDHLIPVFNRYPLDEVIVHPRTGVQMYNGSCNLDAFEKVAENLKHPVVYNGDIRTIEDFYRLKGRFPSITRWMIGRGALFNPFLADGIKGNHYTDKIELLRQFHKKIFELRHESLNYSPHTMDRMKSFWVYFADGFVEGKTIFKKIKKIRDAESYTSSVEKFFDSEPEISF
jgi:tRNA-dihydrouridine synthase